MTLIRKFVTNKYVLLFVAPTAIINSIGAFNDANYRNKYEPDTNKHISPIKNLIIGGLEGIIISPWVNTSLIIIALSVLIECFKKDDN